MKTKLNLYHNGDYYEIKGEMAISAAKTLGVAYTRDTNGVPQCGIPKHCATAWICNLENKGFDVQLPAQSPAPMPTDNKVELPVEIRLSPAKRAASKIAQKHMLTKGAECAIEEIIENELTELRTLNQELVAALERTVDHLSFCYHEDHPVVLGLKQALAKARK